MEPAVGGGGGFANQDYSEDGDYRVGGWLGKSLAALQRSLSFKSAEWPEHVLEGSAGPVTWLVTRSRPGGKLFVSVAVRYGQRYASFRAGWRYDKYWGDDKVVGFNPQPEIVGGYIADVIIKLRMDKLVHY